jgi:predicted DNA binding CopG/RHH family protein
VKNFAWNPEKNEWLKRERGIAFEDVVFHIEAGDEIDVFEHPNQKKFPGQKISVVLIEGYAWLVPMNKLDLEETEILEAYETGNLRPIKNRSREMARHRKTAEATFAKDSRINIRISSKDLRALQKRALAEGMPYQTLVSSVLHKFVEGQISERPTNKRSRRTR